MAAWSGRAAVSGLRPGAVVIPFTARALMCATVLGITGGLMVWGAVDFVKVAVQVARG